MLRVTALALLLVFGLTASAVAECAWVLWEHASHSKTNRIDTEPVAAHTSKQECERAITSVLATFTPSPGVVVNKDSSCGDVFVTHKNKDGSMWTQGFKYLCLPDTVDARGPKAK